MVPNKFDVFDKKVTFNPFQANVPLVYPLKTLENL